MSATIQTYTEIYKIPEEYLTERLKFLGCFASRIKAVVYWNGSDLLVAMSKKYHGYYAVKLDCKGIDLALMLQLLPSKGYYATTYNVGIIMRALSCKDISTEMVTKKFESDRDVKPERYRLKEGYPKKIAMENLKTVTDGRLTTNRLLPLYGEPFETVDLYPNHAELRNKNRDILLMVGYRDKVVRGRKKRTKKQIPIITLEKIEEEILNGF